MCAVSVNEVIAQLPDIDVVRDRCRAMAAIDAILSPEWEMRYFSFDSAWSPTEQLASMRDGSGNEYSMVFSPDGVWARGFDHESVMSPHRSTPPALWPGLLDGMPEVFRAQVSEPAFCDHSRVLQATVCFWRRQDAGGWECGSPAALPPGRRADGSAELLFHVLLAGSEGYRTFAEEYYEVGADIKAVRHVYALRPLTQEIVTRLNPAVDLADLLVDLREIGFPGEEGHLAED
jgi:hypothetical protein